ncbi:MAG: histidine kinase, partial [Chitinophagaceae bacterium]|nr:histidine kinase [Chitinophagaceae bacterium]
VYVVDHDSVFNYLDIEDAIQVTDIYFDGRYTWVCSKNGIYRYLGKKCTAHFFAGDAVSGIIKDREGSYWVTTLNRGVLYVPSMQVLQLLPGKKISRLGAHGGTLWIGGSENDYYIKTGDQLSERHLPADWNMNKISNFRFYDDRIYVVARSGLVAISNNNTQTFQFNINDILEDDDRIFVATTFTARIDRKELTPGLRYYINKRAILWKRTNVLCKDNNSNIWIGTNFGLYQYHIHTATPELINMGDMYDDLSVSIEDIYYDAEQNVLLVATASKGLLLLQNGKIIRKIRTAEGLNNNSVNTIKKIREHIYLAGTNDGLNKIVLDTAKPKVYNYNTRIGIRNKRIRDIEAIDGIVYLATDDGVLYFSMQDLKPLSVQPICSILDVRIDKSSWKGEKMNYKENDISISFNGISYIDRGNLLYYYRFTDYESKWYTTKETQVNYKDLPPGSYTFELYCVNGLGNRSPVQSVAFEILPPFWVEIWFRLLLGLVLVGLIFGVVRYRFKRQEARNAAEMVSIQAERDKARLETQMLELEQRSLRMQMNPHFIFNALNTIKGYYTEGNDVKASSYISKFSRLLRMILENEGQNTTLENEVAMLKLYLDLNKIRYQDKFSYEIQVDKELIQSDIMIPNLLLQPLVENALIHGLANKEEHGHLLVSFNRSAHKMICTVQDDGIGRAEAARQKGRALHQSKALSIVKDRLRLFSSRSTLDIYDLEQDGQPVGTKVVIAIPV